MDEIDVDYILGPRNLNKYTKGDITIYVFGERHTEYSSCKRCDNNGNFIRTPLFISNLLESKERIENNIVIDFYLEQLILFKNDPLIISNPDIRRRYPSRAQLNEKRYKINKKNPLYFPSKNDKVLILPQDCNEPEKNDLSIIRTMIEGSANVLNPRESKYELVRIHSVDIRNSPSLFAIEKPEAYLLDKREILDLFKDKCLFMKNNIDNINDTVIISKINKNIQRTDIDVSNVLQRLLKDAIELIKKVYFSPNYIKTTDDIIANPLNFPEIVKIPRALIGKYYNEKVGDNPDVTFLDQIYTLLNLVSEEDINYSDLFNLLEENLSIINTETGLYIMDIYTIARMLRQYKDGSSPKNIIYYGGDQHAENIGQILKSLGFDCYTFAKHTPLGEGNIDHYCIDISKIKTYSGFF